MKIKHEDYFTIYYENTDSSGFVYHTSYLAFAERSRSNILKKYFPEVLNLLKDNSFFFVIKNIAVDYLKPSFLFDILRVQTSFKKNTTSSIELLQEFKKEDSSICNVNVTLVWINGRTKKPSRVPTDIIARFKLLKVV